MSDLTVFVTLLKSDGVVAAVEYQGNSYFVEMQSLSHIRDNIYSIATYLLDFRLA